LPGGPCAIWILVDLMPLKFVNLKF
jgi:hypothetical protein